MPKFGATSRHRLNGVDPRLQEILNEAIKIVDFSVLESFRDQETQNAMFRDGKSKLRWPDSKHNRRPSLAADIAPYPIDWNDIRRFDRLSGVIFGIAHSLKIQVRWGGDWDRDWDLFDNRFNDLPHFELFEEEGGNA